MKRKGFRLNLNLSTKRKVVLKLCNNICLLSGPSDWRFILSNDLIEKTKSFSSENSQLKSFGNRKKDTHLGGQSRRNLTHRIPFVTSCNSWSNIGFWVFKILEFILKVLPKKSTEIALFLYMPNLKFKLLTDSNT